MRTNKRWFLAGEILKKQLVVLFVFGLASLALAGQAYGETVRRVTLQVSSGTFIVAADALDDVGGAGTDLDSSREGFFCDTHFNKVDIDANHVTLIGKVVDAADPNNLGAFVKITAKADGTAHFVFQTLSGVGGTGAAGIDLSGTVKITELK
jgi:hypothetical protein